MIGLIPGWLIEARTPMTPSVLHFIVCDRVHTDPGNLHALNIDGLKWSIRSTQVPAFPFVLPRLTVLALFMGGEGEGEFTIQVVQDNPRHIITTSRQPHPIRFVGGPYEVHGMKGFVQNCKFRRPGLYWVELLDCESVIARQPLRVAPEVSHEQGQ